MLMPRWFVLLLPASLLILALGPWLGTGPARAEPLPHAPTLAYVDPNGGTFKAGKRQLGALCWTTDSSGAMDYTRCCPDGFSPVGITVGGDLACLMR